MNYEDRDDFFPLARFARIQESGRIWFFFWFYTVSRLFHEKVSYNQISPSDLI